MQIKAATSSNRIGNLRTQTAEVGNKLLHQSDIISKNFPSHTPHTYNLHLFSLIYLILLATSLDPRGSSIPI